MKKKIVTFLKIGDTVKVKKSRMEDGDPDAPSEAKVVEIAIHDIIFQEAESVEEIKWADAIKDRTVVITLDNEFEVYAKDITPV